MTNLQKIRTNAGYSQKELADRAGVSVRMLQHYEQGRKNIDGAKIETLAALAIALDCSIREIMENPKKVLKARL